MIRSVAAAIAATALLLGACENDSVEGQGHGYAPYDSCRQFASCGTCTPVPGCGWCFDSDGNGLCASGPDECVTPVFSWTWNPSGCRIPADAGAVVEPALDAGLASTDGGSASEDSGAAPAMVDAAFTPTEAALPEGDAQIEASPPP